MTLRISSPWRLVLPTQAFANSAEQLLSPQSSWVTEREETQNTNTTARENVVNRYLPEKPGGWEWREEVSAGSSPGGPQKLPSWRSLCKRWGVWWAEGLVAGWRTKEGKGKGKGASTFQGNIVEGIQDWIGCNHWWFILRKSQRASFPPVSSVGISQAKRAAQFESLGWRNLETIT